MTIQHAETLYYAGKLDAALDHVVRATPDDKAGQARMLTAEGRFRAAAIFFTGAALDEALQPLEQAEGLAGDDPLLLAAIFDAMGMAHYYAQVTSDQPDFSTARGYIERAFAMRQSGDDSRAQAESLFHMGLLHQMMGDDAQALGYLEEAYQRAADHPYERSFAARHLALLAQDEDELATAQTYFDESLKLREALGLRLYLPFSHRSCGDVAAQMADTLKAEGHYRKAYAIALEIGMDRPLLLAAQSLGAYLEETGKEREAGRYLEEARSLAEDV